MIKTDVNSSIEPIDVFVIDDDEDILHLLILHLIERGIRAKGMTSGTDLVEILVRNPPRLVLLDVMMPILNGYTLYSAIKSEEALSDTLVYFISALPERNVAWYARTSGAAGFIPKPFSMADIDIVLDSVGFGRGAVDG
jgi:two-component system chemotaxis response regulator CheY